MKEKRGDEYQPEKLKVTQVLLIVHMGRILSNAKNISYGHPEDIVAHYQTMTAAMYTKYGFMQKVISRFCVVQLSNILEEGCSWSESV